MVYNRHMSDFKWFKDLNTGLVGQYPENFASLFDFIEVDPNEVGCIDCGVPDPEPVPAAAEIVSSVRIAPNKEKKD